MSSEMSKLLVGSTITGFEWRDPEYPHEGFVMRLSDGTTLRTWEHGQVGEIRYSITEKTNAE